MNKQLECPNCHKMNRPDATFCAFCGSALNKSTTRNNYSQQKKGWFSRHKWLSLLLLVILLALFGGGSVLGWQSYQNKNSGNKIISTFKTNPKKIYYNKLSATDRKKLNFKFTAIQIPGSDMGGGNYKVKENIKNATNKSVRFHLKSFYLSNNGVNDHIMSKLKGNITIQPGKSYTIKKVFNNVGGQSLVIGYFSYLNDNFKLAYITHSLFKLKGCTSNNLTNKSLIKQLKLESMKTD